MQLTTIVACKDRDNIRACIASMAACRPRPLGIVVDFGSKVPIAFPEHAAWLRVIRVDRNTEMFHKARALNIGIRAVRTKFLCITDADQIFQPNFFGVMATVQEATPRSFVMCKTYSLIRTPESVQFDPAGVLFSTLLSEAKRSKIVLHGDGCCNGVSTGWTVSVRGYDESYIGYRAQDSDFALRAIQYGLKKIWIEKYTSMIHIPHPRVGEYYSTKYRNTNKEKYKKKTKMNPRMIVIANPSGRWGEL